MAQEHLLPEHLGHFCNCTTRGVLPSRNRRQDTNFRFVDKSTLPTKIKNITASGRAKFDLIEIASLGGSPIGIGAQFERVETVGLEMRGVSIEYMNAPKITEYYQSQMSEMCKIYLDFSGFIFQAIKVDQLIYTFYGFQGEKIELDTGALEELIELGFEN